MAIKNQTDFLIFSVIIVGLLFEWANKSWLMPNTNYIQFYVTSSAARAVLLIYTALIVYYIKVSVLLWLFMFINLCAILLNILYLDSSNYYIFNDFRRDYFAPTYRALEVVILLWTIRGALSHLSHLSHIVIVIRHRLGFMATRRRIHSEAKKA